MAAPTTSHRHQQPRRLTNRELYAVAHGLAEPQPGAAVPHGGLMAALAVPARTGLQPPVDGKVPPDRRIGNAKQRYYEMKVAAMAAEMRYVYGPFGPGIEARYDAAQTTDSNQRYWAATDILSADAANSLPVRKTLRERARYEVANNSFLRGVVLSLADFVVGRGPRLQIHTDNPELNRKVEMAWMKWSTAIRLGRKLRLLHMARTQDGEGFAVEKTNAKLATPEKLDLLLVECDRVSRPWDLNYADMIDGITLDEADNPVSYFILNSHPGDSVRVGGDALEGDEVDAALVYHWFRRDRPEQHRGLPDIMAALSLLPMLRAYGLAVVKAARTAASISGALTTPAPANESDADIQPMETIELEDDMFTVLSGGADIKQITPQQPSTTHSEFVRVTQAEGVRCLCMPYNLAAGDSSKFNYSSAKLDRETFQRRVGIEQSDIADEVVNRLTEHWLAEAQMVEKWPQKVLDAPREYMWDGPKRLDPREANADETDLGDGKTGLYRLYAEEGLDADTELAKEAELMGISAEEYKKRLLDKRFGPKAQPGPAPVVAKDATSDESADEDEVVDEKMGEGQGEE